MRKKLLSMALCLCMVLTCIPVAAFAADEDTVYISTAEQLKQLADEVNAGDSKAGKTYILQNDIDLSAYADGEGWTPIGNNYSNPFSGIFDGQGHTITGLKINRPEKNYQGLLGYTKGTDERKVQVENVIVKNADIKGKYYVGAIVGDNRTGLLNNCGVIGGNIEGNDFHVGGITGSNNGSINNCYVTGDVSGSGDYVGGIVGENCGPVNNCYVTGNISSLRNYIGGIAGYNPSGKIQNCYVTGNVKGLGAVGGITGANPGTNSIIENCYVTGAISGENNTGGIVGSSYGKVQNNIALNEKVTNSSKAYRIVRRDGGTVSNNYAWSAMTVNGEIVTDGTKDNQNGENLSCTDGKLSKQFADIFTDKDAWTFTDNRLPILKGFTTEQSKALPEWISPSHTITIETDSNGTATSSVVKAQQGDIVTLTAEPNEGYHFSRWESNVEIKDNAFTMGAENVTIKAIFEANTYKVTLNTNGGTIADGKNVESYTYGTEVVLPTEITKTGYSLDGWYMDEDLTQQVKQISKTDLGDKTFYAKWTAIDYTITVENDGNGKAEASKQTANIGDEVTLTATPNKGYHFSTWESNVEIKDNAFTMGAENVTVKAIFEKDEEPPIDKPTTKPVEEVFNDVQTTDWFYPEIQYVYDNGLMNGTGTDFEPNTVLTRSMMMTILWRMDGKPAPSGATSFTDVKAGEWYADAIAWAQQNNISNGYGDGTFGTFDSITREQVTAIFYRYAKYKGYDVSASADLSAYSDAGRISNYASAPMQWAVGCGLMKGRTTTTLEPQGTATRAEAATIMHRFDTIVKK